MRKAIVLFVLTLATSVRADWPTFNHDIRRSGATEEKLEVERLGEAWRFTSAHPPAPAWYGPARWDAYSKVMNLKSMRNYDPCFHVVSVGDAAYFGSTVDDAVRCVDANTGKQRWIFITGGPVRIAPTVDDGRVYFGSDDGYAYCVSASDGTLIWKTSASDRTDRVLHNGRIVSRWPVRSGVLIDGGTAYFAASLLPWEEAYVCAVDAESGKPEGDGRYRKMAEGELTFEGPLLASPTQLIVPQGRVAPLLLNRANGDVIGSVERGGGSFVLLTPDRKLLHGPGNKDAQIYESDTVDRKAKIASFEGGNAIVIDGNRSYLLADAELVAVDRTQRRRLWTTPVTMNLSMVLAGDTLFVGGTDEVGAFDANTGKPRWRSSVIGRAYGLAVANGGLYVSTDEGVVHCFRSGGDGEIVVPTFGERIPSAAKTIARNDPGLVGRWVFQKDATEGPRVVDRVGGVHASPTGTARIERAGAYEAIELDGATASVPIANTLPLDQMPKRAITVEAWVRIDKTSLWGGIVSAIQDDGDQEFGWLLGYREDKFCFGLATETTKKLTYLTAAQAFVLGGWHHVAGVYDGERMTLVVDGKVAATSEDQGGDIIYPNKTFYEIGAYHDSNENFPLTGAVHEAAVYERAIPIERLAELHAAKAAGMPKPVKRIELADGPWHRFTKPGEATIRWRTDEPTATRLVVELGDEQRIVTDDAATTDHTATLDGLRRNRNYRYTIEIERDGETLRTEAFDCETFFDYTMRDAPAGSAALATDADRKAAKAIVDQAGVSGGIVVLYGTGRLGAAVALAESTDMRAIIVDEDADSIDAVREKLVKAGVYGVRVEAHVIGEGEAVYDAAFANVVVASVGDAAAMETGKRMVQPARGVVIAMGEDGAVADRWGAPPIEGAGTWTHQYGSADNSAFGGETLGGISSADSMRVQWVGRPGPRYQSDREHRDSAPLAINGRLLAQGWKRLLAIDQYNGAILWSLELPRVVRFNVTRDCANWCVDGDRVYIAVGANAWVVDMETGELLERRAVPPGRAASEGQAWEWGYIARAGDLLLGTSTHRGTEFDGLWGGDNWYEEQKGEYSSVVGADKLFAQRAADGAPAWEHTGGLVIHPTITVADGRVHFVEVRSEADLKGTTRRLHSDSMWQDMHLVTLDLATGKKVWEQKLDVPRGFSILTAHGADRVTVVVSSARGAFDVMGFDAVTGAPAWRTETPWENKGQLGPDAGHHGSQLQRPAIVGERMYLRPAVFNVRTGERIGTINKPGHGCGTYAATAYSLIFRSESLGMWDSRGNSVSNWSRLRPDCWLSTIPAGGMILSTEGGGGCSCGSWMETSLGFAPRRPAKTDRR